MAYKNDLLTKINTNYAKFSKGQRILARFITEEYDKAVFLTAAKLGEAVGVSESTVVRFAGTLGYKGFPEFQKALEELVLVKLNQKDKQEVTFGKIDKDNVLQSVLTTDMERIKETLSETDETNFNIAQDLLCKARTIYVIGLRSCEILSDFLSFYLNLMFPDVRQIKTTSVSEIFEQMVHISKDDVIVGISFPRYSMRTLKALEFANMRQAKIITISDSIHSPLNLYSSCNLVARSNMASFVDSLVAPLSLINALILSLSIKKQNGLTNTLNELEDIWNDYQVYDNDEIDHYYDKDIRRYNKP